jgi:hypothetical protein
MLTHLQNSQVQEMDKAHVRDPDEPAAVRFVYNASVWGLDLLYVGRPIQRFWSVHPLAACHPLCVRPAADAPHVTCPTEPLLSPPQPSATQPADGPRVTHAV